MQKTKVREKKGLVKIGGYGAGQSVRKKKIKRRGSKRAQRGPQLKDSPRGHWGGKN